MDIASSAACGGKGISTCGPDVWPRGNDTFRTATFAAALAIITQTDLLMGSSSRN